jgi:hypothetical protein
MHFACERSIWYKVDQFDSSARDWGSRQAIERQELWAVPAPTDFGMTSVLSALERR